MPPVRRPCSDGSARYRGAWSGRLEPDRAAWRATVREGRSGCTWSPRPARRRDPPPRLRQWHCRRARPPTTRSEGVLTSSVSPYPSEGPDPSLCSGYVAAHYLLLIPGVSSNTHVSVSLLPTAPHPGGQDQVLEGV